MPDLQLNNPLPRRTRQRPQRAGSHAKCACILRGARGRAGEGCSVSDCTPRQHRLPNIASRNLPHRLTPIYIHPSAQPVCKPETKPATIHPPPPGYPPDSPLPRGGGSGLPMKKAVAFFMGTRGGGSKPAAQRQNHLHTPKRPTCMYSHPPKVSDKARRRRQYAVVRRGDATQYEAFGGWL